MLPQLLPAPDFLVVVYRPDLRVLIVRWQRQTTTEELYQGYFTLLDLATSLNCSSWFLDVRGRDDSNKQHTQWMIEHFFPLLPQHFSVQVCIAYLFSPSHLVDLETAPEVPTLAYFDDKPYCVGRFIEEAKALAWLQDRQVEHRLTPASTS
jgi:hypothetical protein